MELPLYRVYRNFPPSLLIMADSSKLRSIIHKYANQVHKRAHQSLADVDAMWLFMGGVRVYV